MIGCYRSYSVAQCARTSTSAGRQQMFQLDNTSIRPLSNNKAGITLGPMLFATIMDTEKPD